MWDLFKIELMRFRGWVVACAFVHLSLLLFGSRVSDLASLPSEPCFVVAAVYVVTALLLGLYQMGGHRRPNAWVNLLHRPVPHWKIAAALFSAGAMLLAIAILLPLMVIGVWQEWLTPRVFDTRHWWLLLSAWLLGLCAYLTGGYALLASRRHGICALSVLVLLVMSNAAGIGAILLQMAAVAWLAALVYQAFKPDLAAPPRGPLGAVVTAIPLMSSVWLVTLFLGSIGELAWMMQGSHPNQVGAAQAGSSRQAEVADGRDLIIAGLSPVISADAEFLREQSAHADVLTIRTNILNLPVRNDLTNNAPLQFSDPRRRIRWVFSHDSMRFEGIGLDDERSRGRLGVMGDRAFTAPPLPFGRELLLSRDAVYRYSSDRLRISPRMRVPRGETIVDVDPIGERVGLLTDRALRIYDRDSPSMADELLQPRFQMPFTGKVGALRRVDVMELPDGLLVSMLFSRRLSAGDHAPFQELARLIPDGRASVIARRELANGFGTLFSYRNWYTSPVLVAMQRWALNLFSAYDPRQELDRRPVPRLAWIIAFGFGCASLFAAAWRLQRLDIPPIAKAAWLLACVVLSVPAVVSLWLIYLPRERLDDLRRPLPALGSAVAT